nr:uncharacterized protein LOC112030645 [Quercus suber]
MDENNTWRVESEEINLVLVNYYRELFSSSRPNPQWPQLEHIPLMITEEMNSALTGTFTALEVKEALKQMAPLKAPGPDGMPPLFFQHFWGVVEDDVTNSVLSWLNSGTIPHPLNHTFITLIPKIQNPVNVSDYRPISLCNVLYKIFSKVLANRLKRILPSIISEHQSAFTKNRLISDNILVAYESLHYMNNMRTGKTGYMAVKLDMSKAYDRVEWVYLENVMRKLGFCERWIGLIMVCIKTVTYSILVNGEPQGLIQPTRGIRQGDPLSPFLFLLCTEGLHGLIQHSVRMGELRGLSISRNGPKLTHLLFADDSLLFCRSTIEECRKILEILEIYEEGSGQKVNKNKTAIFFSQSTPEATKVEIKEALGLQEIVQYDKYLGLPSLVGRRKKETRFFPNCSIMEAKESSTGSYAWRSILHGRNVLLRGCRWRVGNGRSVHIWQSKWLPRKHLTKVLSPIIDSMVDARVEILIDDETHGWNHSIIDGIFIPEEAELIKSMPLPQHGVDDRLFWPFTQTGAYTSKSGYRYLKSEEEDSRSAVRSEEDRELWRGIWASRNSLPTKENLVRRTVIDNPLCDRCSGAHESALHAVWSCAELDVVWEDVTLWSCRGSLTFFTFKELLSWLIKNQQHVELFSVTAWTIWNQRNQVRLNKPSCSSHQISQLAKERLQEFMAVNALPHSSQTGPPTVQKWKPPEQENSAGVGVVIRNSEGLVLGSLSKLVPLAYSPLEIEATAIATALEFASDLGFQRAIIETDSLVLVKALREDSEFLSAVGLILDEIRRKVNFFNELHYSHVKREGNIVAHKLARHAISVSDIVVWMEDVPPLLFPVVLADIAGFS